MIMDYKMPMTNFVRTSEELDYCDEPDIWHDVMGHIPYLAEIEYSEMYQLLAQTYVLAFNSNRKNFLKQLHFIGGMIIELGLIREPSGIKAFGSTFYSSGEVREAFKKENQLLFTLDALVHQALNTDPHKLVLFLLLGVGKILPDDECRDINALCLGITPVFPP